MQTSVDHSWSWGAEEHKSQTLPSRSLWSSGEATGRAGKRVNAEDSVVWKAISNRSSGGRGELSVPDRGNNMSKKVWRAENMVSEVRLARD